MEKNTTVGSNCTLGLFSYNYDVFLSETILRVIFSLHCHSAFFPLCGNGLRKSENLLPLKTSLHTVWSGCHAVLTLYNVDELCRGGELASQLDIRPLDSPLLVFLYSTV